MKTAKILMMALIMTLGLSSCSDNEKDEPQQPAANEIAGSYTGTMTGTAMGTDLTFDNVDVRITAADDSHVDIAIASFGNPPMVLPEIFIGNVPVSGAEGNFALAATQFSGTSPDGKNYSGTIQGTSKGELVLNMELNYGNMPMPLVCKYTANKK